MKLNSKKAMAETMIKEEIMQVKRTGLNCYKYGFISRAGFEEIKTIKEDLILITLDQLFQDSE